MIYLHLVREWGTSRAGAYAFVSPVVAVLLGALVYGERPGAWEAAGTAIMLSTARLALREDQGPAAAPRHEEGHACRSTPRPAGEGIALPGLQVGIQPPD